MLRRTYLCVPSTVVLGVVIVGCSAGSPSSRSSGAAPSSTGSAKAGSPAQALPDGARLETALLSGSAMPAGFRIDTSGERNTGSQTPFDTSQPLPASQVCGALTATSWIEVAGIEASAFAQNDYINTARTAEIAQEADTFTGGDARRAMTAIWRVFGKCAKFTQGSGGTQGSGDTTATYTMTRERLAGVGDDAIEAVQTSVAYDGGTTLVAIRVGNEIVTTMDSSPDSDKGRGAVGYAERIAKNLP